MHLQRNTAFRLTVFYLLVISFTLSGIFLGSRTVTVMSQSKPIYRSRCIVIDAGHGGFDGGAVSCTGLPESKYNLEIALRLEDFLHLMGYQTKMIRREDISVCTSGNTIAQKKVSDIRQRVKAVNDGGEGTVLVSIHQNFFEQSQYAGAQVFYGRGEDSKALAQTLQQLLINNLHQQGNRKEKKASGIYLLEKVQYPAILVECGFLSNSREEAMLADSLYQKHLAVNIGCGVIQWFTNA